MKKILIFLLSLAIVPTAHGLSITFKQTSPLQSHLEIPINNNSQILLVDLSMISRLSNIAFYLATCAKIQQAQDTAVNINRIANLGIAASGLFGWLGGGIVLSGAKIIINDVLNYNRTTPDEAVIKALFKKIWNSDLNFTNPYSITMPAITAGTEAFLYACQGLNSGKWQPFSIIPAPKKDKPKPVAATANVNIMVS